MKTIEERLIARSVRDPESGCLRWIGVRNHKGYGQIHVGGSNIGAHRAAYEAWVGPIPDGHEIDHVRARGCVHRDCIEPAHLEAVTHIENVRRSMRDSCPSGHEYTKANTRIRPCDGTRACRACEVQRIEPVACECGAMVSEKNMSRHRRSPKHNEMMERTS